MKYSGLKALVVLLCAAVTGGCASPFADGFPDLSSINRVSGETLTKEQKDEEIKRLQKEQEAHKKEAEK